MNLTWPAVELIERDESALAKVLEEDKWCWPKPLFRHVELQLLTSYATYNLLQHGTSILPIYSYSHFCITNRAFLIIANNWCSPAYHIMNVSAILASIHKKCCWYVVPKIFLNVLTMSTNYLWKEYSQLHLDCESIEVYFVSRAVCGRSIITISLAVNHS